MSDPKTKGVREASKAATVGLVAAAAHALGANEIVALAAGSLAKGVAEFYQALASGNTDSVANARVEALREDVVKLVRRVDKLEAEVRAAGLEPDRTDPISREQTVTQFVRDIFEARTIVKREALVNAAANQHDPRIAGPATRAFWYGVLRDLSDIQVHAVRLVVRHEYLAAFGDAVIALGPSEGSSRAGLPVDETEAHSTLQLVLGELVDVPGPRRVVEWSHVPEPRQIVWQGQMSGVSRRYGLTPGGRILARLIAD